MTPTSNRSRRASTPQEEQQIPQFQGMSYISQFPDPNSPFQPFPFQQLIHFDGQIPYSLTYEGMVAHGMRPTNFGNPPLHTQIHQHQNQFNTEVEKIVSETQQSNPTSESNPKGKGKNVFDMRSKKQPWTRVEEEALMRAYIDVSVDSVVGNAQPGGMFLLLLLLLLLLLSL